MRPEAAKLLWDAANAASKISDLTAESTYDAYVGDPTLPSAVQWQFAVIGEALAQLRRVDPETAEKVRELHRIVAFRNTLVHGYGSIDHAVVWRVIKTDLLALRKSLERLLQEP